MRQQYVLGIAAATLLSASGCGGADSDPLTVGQPPREALERALVNGNVDGVRDTPTSAQCLDHRKVKGAAVFTCQVQYGSALSSATLCVALDLESSTFAARKQEDC